MTAAKKQPPKHKRRSQTLSSDLYLTDDEWEMLQDNIRETVMISPRNAALIGLAAATGARAQEVLNVRPKDLNQKTNEVYIRGLKGSYDRELPIQSALMKLLVSLIEDEKQKLVFDIKYRQMVKIWYQVSPVKKKLHALRHTRAMRVLQKMGDPSAVKTQLGHRSFMSTQIYLDHHVTKAKLKLVME